MIQPGDASRRPWASGMFRWALVTGAVVVLGAVVLERAVVPRQLRSAEAAVRNEMRLQLEVRRAAIERWIVDALSDARTVAAFPSTHALVTRERGSVVDREFTRILQDYSAQHDIEALGVFDARHRLVGSTPYHQFGDSAWHHVTGAPSRVHPERVEFVELTTGEREVSVRVPVHGTEGCVHAAIDPKRWLSALLASRALPTRGSRLALVEEREGMRTVDALSFGDSHPTGPEDLVEQMHIPGVAWTLKISVPRAEALRPALARARVWELGTLLLLGSLVSLGFALAWGQRRAVDAAVQRGRARFSLLLEHANDSILFLDDDGVILRCNQRAEEFYGVPAGGLTGRQLLRDLTVHGSAEGKLPADGVYEATHRAAGGREVAVEVSSRRSDAGGRPVTVALVRDVQERHDSERRLRRMNRFLESAAAVGQVAVRVDDEEQLIRESLAKSVDPGGLLLAAVAARGPDGVLHWGGRSAANDAIAAIEIPLAFAEQVLESGESVTLEPLPSGADAPAWMRALAAAGAQGLLCHPILVGERSFGVGVLVSPERGAFDGESMTILANISRDVAFALDSLRERRARRDLEATLQALFESGPIGIAILDGDDRVMEANAEFLRILGYGRDGALGGGLVWRQFCLCEPGGDGAMPCDTSAPFETDFRRADGSRIAVYVGRVRLEASRARSVAVALDLTAQRLTAESLRQTQMQLVQAQKMETIGRLAGGVAHDFNNLLTVIQGYTQIVQAGSTQSEADASALAQVLRAAERAASLTRQMLAFSRQQVLEPHVLDLGQVLTDTEKMIRRLIGEDVEILMRIPGNLGRVKADPVQVEQVLLNLVVNARDAMPRGGQLTLELANFEASAEFAAQHPDVGPGEYVLLSVSDDGEGIEPDVLPRIFEPFFTTKETGKGTGLGLATVYGVVRQSGGTIWVRSARHEGSSFHILLPRVYADDESSGAAPKRAAGRGETVLVVEDDDMVRPITVAMLERLGYRVISAADADAALAVSRQHAGRVDLLLSDVVMRGRHGPELAEAFLRERPGVPVLFVTGYTHDPRTVELLSAGGIPYLAKPFSLDALAHAVRRAISAHASGPARPLA